MYAASDTAGAEEAAVDNDQMTSVEAEHVTANQHDETELAGDDITNTQPPQQERKHVL